MSMLPDREALMVEALRAAPAPAEVLTALTRASGSRRISTRLGSEFPAVRVSLVAGTRPPVTGTGAADFQLDCWGNGAAPADEVAAALLARWVEDVADTLHGTYSSGRIVSSYLTGTFLHSPDPGTARERYIVGVSIILQADEPL